MLIHIAPRIFLSSSLEPCHLVSVTSLDLDLRLWGDEDVVARRPYPNKLFLVACRKTGRKAIDGILIEAPSIREFAVVTRWSILLRGGLGVVSHRVHYTVLDDEHDAVSDSMITWYGTGADRGGWSSRYPEPPSFDYCPASRQPRMDASRDDASRKLGDIEDCYDEHGNIIERNERFYMPTIERDRLLPSALFLGDRAPAFNHAFVAGPEAGG